MDKRSPRVRPDTRTLERFPRCASWSYTHVRVRLESSPLDIHALSRSPPWLHARWCGVPVCPVGGSGRECARDDRWWMILTPGWQRFSYTNTGMTSASDYALSSRSRRSTSSNAQPNVSVHCLPDSSAFFSVFPPFVSFSFSLPLPSNDIISRRITRLKEGRCVYVLWVIYSWVTVLWLAGGEASGKRRQIEDARRGTNISSFQTRIGNLASRRTEFYEDRDRCVFEFYFIQRNSLIISINLCPMMQVRNFTMRISQRLIIDKDTFSSIWNFVKFHRLSRFARFLARDSNDISLNQISENVIFRRKNAGTRMNFAFSDGSWRLM